MRRALSCSLTKSLTNEEFPELLVQTTLSPYIPGRVRRLDAAVVVALAVLAASTRAGLNGIEDSISATDAEEDGLSNGVLVDIVDLGAISSSLSDLLVVVTCGLLEKRVNSLEV